MKVVDLNGKSHTWNLKGYQVNSDDTRPRSQGHLAVRALLKKLYPLDVVLEEVNLPGEQLYLDFFLPSRKLAIEMNGSQHQIYTPFFHQTKPKFYKAQNNDRRKSMWCAANNIKLLTLSDQDEEEIWSRMIINA